ncbi:MAG TPA: hypothetical protein VM122_11085 [Usitatibacter sp.]|nr:hypothetical protein [Usitatibacter sp.]
METVACELKYSGVGVAALLATVTATFVIGLLTPLPALARASVMLFAAASALRACRTLLAPRSLRLDHARRIEIRDDRGWRAGHLRDGSFVMPWLTIIRWRPDGARFDRTLLLLPDMAEAGEMRKIRVILRWA